MRAEIAIWDVGDGERARARRPAVALISRRSAAVRDVIVERRAVVRGGCRVPKEREVLLAEAARAIAV